MKKWLVILLMLNSVFAFARVERNLLQKTTDIDKLKSYLVLNQKWVTYPDYNDRRGWDSLTVGGVKTELIQKGEAALNYEWKVIKATDYLEFDRSGNRKIMEDPYSANRTALYNLVLAELAEGKGRFINQIVNGVWFSCEMTSWSLSAHIAREQTEKIALPSYKEHIIDLYVGDFASFLAWTHYFLKDELDRISPMISARLRKNIQDRILDPYMNRSNFWWQAFNSTSETMVNNWNPWCNFNVLICNMLLENNPDKLANAVYRTMVSVDKFINYTNEDGACEEGPNYWGHAAGRLYDYLQILSYGTGGKISIFNQPIIQNMGEYIAKSYVGNGWVVNFADASAKIKAEKGVIFRYGKAVKSVEMQQFASYLYDVDNKASYYYSNNDIFRTLENLGSHNELTKTLPIMSQAKLTWYPQTEFCYIQNKSGLFLAAKGGYNNESHNHNDMGSFILYVDKTPVFIDAGVGTYTRQTFSDERYSIWSMQSNYHNLPMINGVSQAYGAQFRSRNVHFDQRNKRLTLDLAKAYPAEAAVEKWQRTYQLELNGGLIIQDEFKLIQAKKLNQINFMTWGKPDVSNPGVIAIEKDGAKVKLFYNASQFKATVETIQLSDIKFTNVWGNSIYRLSLNARDIQLSGKYIFTIRKYSDKSK